MAEVSKQQWQKVEEEFKKVGKKPNKGFNATIIPLRGRLLKLKNEMSKAKDEYRKAFSDLLEHKEQIKTLQEDINKQKQAIEALDEVIKECRYYTYNWVYDSLIDLGRNDFANKEEIKKGITFYNHPTYKVDNPWILAQQLVDDDSRKAISDSSSILEGVEEKSPLDALSAYKKWGETITQHIKELKINSFVELTMDELIKNKRWCEEMCSYYKITETSPEEKRNKLEEKKDEYVKLSRKRYTDFVNWVLVKVKDLQKDASKLLTCIDGYYKAFGVEKKDLNLKRSELSSVESLVDGFKNEGLRFKSSMADFHSRYMAALRVCEAYIKEHLKKSSIKQQSKDERSFVYEVLKPYIEGRIEKTSPQNIEVFIDAPKAKKLKPEQLKKKLEQI